MADKNTAPTKDETPEMVENEAQNTQPDADNVVEDVIDETTEQPAQDEQNTREEDSELATALAQAQARPG